VRTLFALSFSVAVAVAGCHSQRLATELPPSNTTAQLTFYRDVLPIMQRSCHGCHTDGGLAFPMATYEQAIEKRDLIVKNVEAGTMPPWLPSDRNDCQPLAGKRKLAPTDKDTILTWAKGLAEKGDPADAPQPPAPKAPLEWVDATLAPGVSYTPNAQLMDDYHCFILDPQLAEDKDLIGFEVVPGARKEVHHVLLYPAAKDKALEKEAATPGDGWTCFGGPGVGSGNQVGGWVPGMAAVRYPDTTGMTLKKGEVLIMQVHYNLANGALPDRTTVKIQLAKERVARPAYNVPLLNDEFRLEPGAMGHTVTREFTMPIDATSWGVTPHMHVKGKSIRVTADDACVIDIPQWDFHWQQFYFFDRPTGIPIKAGTRVKLECVFDNPTTAPVTWGEGTNDEMCLSYFMVTL
jgi:hypothetical protein